MKRHQRAIAAVGFGLVLSVFLCAPGFGKAILFPARDLTLTDAKSGAQSGIEAIQFATTSGVAKAAFTLERDETVEIWVHVRFRWCGDGVKVSVDGGTDEKLPTIVKGQNIWRDTGCNDNENSEVWHWIRTKPLALKKGPHELNLRTVSGECGAEWINRLGIVYGQDGWSVPEIGGPCAGLGDVAPATNHVLNHAGTCILPATDLERINGEREADGVRLSSENAYVAGVFQVNEEQDTEVWLRVYYENKNIFEAPELQEYSRACYLTLDGAMIKTFYETDEKRWHWVSAGKQHLTRGKHAVYIHKRGSPVIVDRMVFYAGADHFKEAWFTAKQTHRLPFNLGNAMSFDDARRAGDWRLFGDLAPETTGQWSRQTEGRIVQPTVVNVAVKQPGQVVLEKVRPIASNPSRATRREPEQYVSLWVKLDGSGARLSVILRDVTGEDFQLLLNPSAEWKGWRFISAAIPRQAPAAMLHGGGNSDGIPDYPLQLSHLALDCREKGKVACAFTEPQFDNAVECRAERVGIKELVFEKKNPKGEIIKDESRAEAKPVITLRNLADNERTAFLSFKLSPLNARFSPEKPDGFFSTREVTLPGKGAQTVELSYNFPRESGIYVLEYGVNADQPKRIFFAHGQASQAALAAYLQKQEKARGAFRFSADGKDKPLVKADGSPIAIGEVEALYGKNPGLTILADGVDVAARAYADSINLGFRLKPRGWDLSDGAGWPDIRVPAGMVAIDPTLGRFKFSEGDADPMTEAGRLIVGFGVPGDSPVQIKGDYGFVCAGEGDLSVLDISNPPQAGIVDFGLSWYFYHKLIFYRNLAFFASSLRGSVCWDDVLSNPSRPGHMRSVNLDRTTFGTFIDAFDEAGIGYTTTHIVDLSDPFNPRPLGLHGLNGLWRPDGSRYGLTMKDDKRKIAVVDLRDPAKPAIVHEFDNLKITGTNGLDRFYDIAAVSEEYILLRQGNHLAVYRGIEKPQFVTEMVFNIPDTPVLGFGYGGGPWHLSGFAFYKDHLYIVDGRIPPNQNYSWTPKYPHSRVYVFAIGKELKQVGTWEDPLPTNYTHLTIDKKGYGYTTDMNFGVHILDLRDPKAPRKVLGVPIASEVRSGGIGEKVAVSGQYFGGAQIVADITDPTHPVRRGYWWDGNYNGCWNCWGMKVAAAGDVFYIPRSVSVAIVDCTNPDQPKQVGNLMDKDGKPLGPSEVLAQDDVLYAATKGLTIYSLDDPLKPAWLSSLSEVNGGIIGMRQGVIFVMAQGQLWAVDVKDARNPKVLSAFKDDRIPGGGPRAAQANGYIYMIQDVHSMLVLDARNPAQIRPMKVAVVLEETDAAPWGDCPFGWMESSGNHLFAINYEGGTHGFDISDPENPRFVGRLRTGMQWILDRVRGGYLYVPTIEGLCVVDVPTASQIPKGAVTVR